VTYQEIRDNEEINTYIRQADMSLSALGYTEHSFAHVTIVAEKAGYILQTLGLNCTPESGHGILQLPCIVDSESATWTGKVHDIPTL
jgi:hypothetical protein